MFPALLALLLPPAVARVPAESLQLILGVAEGWDASSATLRRYERDPGGEWRAVGAPIPARVGREGLAWGLGLHPLAGEGPAKREGDWRAPAGVFSLGDAFGDDPAAPPGARWAYRQVTARDLWVEDAGSPLYNQHVVIGGERPLSGWETGQRMKMGDPAHRLKIAVAHNPAPGAAPGAGRALFRHIWRGGGEHPTSGCTAMSDADLEATLSWLEPGAGAVFALLPAPAP